MSINHLPSLLRRFTDSPLGLFSAAEGFVFLSGLLAGWVYTRKLRHNGYAVLKDSARKRAGLIYRWHLASFLAAFGLVWLLAYFTHFYSLTSPGLFYIQPVLALGLGAVMLYQPGLLDILPLYCALVLLLPWVLQALERGRLARVLIISGSLWLVTQFAPPIVGEPLPPINLGTFNLFGWQFLFVLGLVFGHARTRAGASAISHRPWIMLLAGLIVIHGLGERYYYEQWPNLMPDYIFGLSVNKPALGFFRILDFLSIAYFVTLAASRFPTLFNWRPLAFLGRHSLPVVAAQSVIVMGLLQFPGLFRNVWSNLAVSTAVIGLLYAAAGLSEKFRSRTPNRPKTTPHSPTSASAGKSIGHVVHAIAAADPVHPRS